jgi:hypothetical protein
MFDVRYHEYPLWMISPPVCHLFASAIKLISAHLSALNSLSPRLPRLLCMCNHSCPLSLKPPQTAPTHPASISKRISKSLRSLHDLRFSFRKFGWARIGHIGSCRGAVKVVEGGVSIAQHNTQHNTNLSSSSSLIISLLFFVSHSFPHSHLSRGGK